jgi:outer membrane assembly lipoprotein YfgL
MLYMRSFARWINIGLIGTLLVACASGVDKPKPADLGANPALLGVRTAWTTKIGAVSFPLEIKVNGPVVALATSDGSVVAIDARTGSDLWRSQVNGGILAGVGSDGRFVSVVTKSNELVILDSGREIWRSRLLTQVFTAPLVAGDRVFVLGADRTVAAFDALSGRRLWINQRPSESLVLRQAGVLTAVGNTLVVGLSGHLVGINPANGNMIWDAAIATPRGTNEIERLVDLVGGVSRYAENLCVRSFQTSVACVDSSRGVVTWSRPASGVVGLHGDDQQIYGVESDARIHAWRRTDGELVWSSDRLRFHELSAPLVIGRSVVIGDENGMVHFLSRKDGALLTRLSTDGSAVIATPILASGTLIVVTRNGGVFGFQPE